MPPPMATVETRADGLPWQRPTGFFRRQFEIHLTLAGDHQVRPFEVFVDAGRLQYDLDPALHDGPGKCE